MDRRERIDSTLDALSVALQSFQAGLWTALPAIVNSFDPEQMTISAQPAIQPRFTAPDGTISWSPLPLLGDVPVCFVGGGGATMTFPVKAGDECLIVFASRCVDQWWQTAAVSVQPEPRMHNISDGVAIVGLRSLPRTLTPAVDTSKVQIRSDDGTTYIELGPEDGSVRIQARTIEMHATEKISWDVNGFGKSVQYTGDQEWTVHTWQTPTPPQIVITIDGGIHPPEGP